jgi:hypothetical protein
MNAQKRKVVDDVVSMVASQAEVYRQRLNEETRRVEAYSALAQSSDLREVLEVIVDYSLVQEKRGMTRLELIRKVNFALTLLFTDPFTRQVKIPLDFWQSPLGKLINEANQRSIPLPTASMLNPSDAAREASVSRQTIYSWIENGKLLPIWVSDHPFILEQELQLVVRRMKQKAQFDEEHATAG